MSLAIHLPISTLNIVSTLPQGAWGGSEELWYRAALQLPEDTVHIRTSVPPELRVPNRLRQLPGRKLDLQRRNHLGAIGRVYRRFRRDPALRFLINQKADLTLIAQAGGFDGFMWLRECYRLKLRYSIVCQSGGEYCWPTDSEARELREILEAAESVFFVSEENLRLMQKQLVSELANASIVRNPFNVSYTSAPLWPNDISPLRLACVGRLHAHHKGQDLILELLRTPKWRERDLEVTFYGHGPNEKMLKEYCQVHRITAAKFMGVVDNVESIWERHHALIHPSRHEGLPLAIVEAMLCSRPCVTTNVAGNAELIEDDITGFIAPAPTKALLDQAMERMWHRRHELQSIGKLAAAAVRRQIPANPAEIFAETLLNLICSVRCQANASS